MESSGNANTTAAPSAVHTRSSKPPSSKSGPQAKKPPKTPKQGDEAGRGNDEEVKKKRPPQSQAKKKNATASSSTRGETIEGKGTVKLESEDKLKNSTKGEEATEEEASKRASAPSQRPQHQSKKKSSPRGSEKKQSSIEQGTVSKLLQQQEEEDDDEERCIVCCERMTYCGLGECGHRTCCGLCSFRLRQLHKDDKCVLCKTKLERLFFVQAHGLDTRTYADLSKLIWGNVATGGLVMDEQVSSIWFTKETIPFKNEMDALREHRCGECPLKFPNIRLMERHLAEVHGKQLCTMCLEFRGLFFMEHRRMAPSELALHCKSGDGTKSFEGHPSCKFCKGLMFYNTDQLYKHLNEAHESCHLCAKTGNRYQYFRDYRNLELHFEQDHFMCDEPRCREHKFVAFATELQLQAHIATEHPEKLDQRTSALNLDFVVKGSRRFQGAELDTFRPSRSPSPAPDAFTSARMAAEDFPRLNPRSQDEFPPLGNATSAMAAPSATNRRYAQTTASNVSSSMDSRRLFAGLKHLAGPSAEQEVRSWCARLVSGLTSPEDFYDYMFNLLGEVTLNIIFEDIQSLVGSDLARKLEALRKSKTGVSSSSSARRSVASLSSEQQRTFPVPASLVRFDDPSSFPSLGRPSSSSSANNRLSRAEVREIAFGSKKGGSGQGRQVSAPVGVRPAMGWKKKEEEEYDQKLDLGTSSKKSQKQKKSERDRVMEMAVKFGQ